MAVVRNLRGLPEVATIRFNTLMQSDGGSLAWEVNYFCPRLSELHFETALGSSRAVS